MNISDSGRSAFISLLPSACLAQMTCRKQCSLLCVQSSSAARVMSAMFPRTRRDHMELHLMMQGKAVIPNSLRE